MNFLLEKLQEAIDEAIADSDRINAIVAEMKRSGYELSLVLESSIAISPIEASQLADCVDDSRLTSTGEIALTGEDLEFLQELNISL